MGAPNARHYRHKQQAYPITANQARTADSRDMASVADELIALARSIRAQYLDAPEAQHDNQDEQSTQAQERILSTRKLLFMAQQAYEDRRRRDKIVGQPDLFGEPAWDILLDLFVAYLSDKNVSISSACIGSAAPPTTGLRWLDVLEEAGLVVREKDLQDQHRTLVRISDAGIDQMSQYFHALP